MGRRLGWLVWKDLLDALRSQTAQVVLLAPFLLALILHLTLRPEDVRKISLLIVAPQDSGLARKLQGHPGLLVEEVADREQGLRRLRPGGAVLLLEVGEGFDEQLLEGRRPGLKIWKEPSRPTQVVLARAFVDECLRQQAGQKLPARVKPQTVGAGKSGDLMFAACVVMAAMSSMIVAASNLVEEKEAGTLQQILLSPAGSTEVWAGKLAVSSALGTVAAMSVVVLRGSTLTSFWGALGLTAVACFVFAALGGVIGLLAKGPAAASSWTGLCFITLFTPVAFSETSENLSRWAKFSPAYPLYDGLQRTVLAQESVATLAANFGVLITLGALLTLFGGRLLSRYR